MTNVIPTLKRACDNIGIREDSSVEQAPLILSTSFSSSVMGKNAVSRRLLKLHQRSVKKRALIDSIAFYRVRMGEGHHVSGTFGILTLEGKALKIIIMKCECVTDDRS